MKLFHFNKLYIDCDSISKWYYLRPNQPWDTPHIHCDSTIKIYYLHQYRDLNKWGETVVIPFQNDITYHSGRVAIKNIGIVISFQINITHNVHRKMPPGRSVVIPFQKDITHICRDCQLVCHYCCDSLTKWYYLHPSHLSPWVMFCCDFLTKWYYLHPK